MNDINVYVDYAKLEIVFNLEEGVITDTFDVNSTSPYYSEISFSYTQQEKTQMVDFSKYFIAFCEEHELNPMLMKIVKRRTNPDDNQIVPEYFIKVKDEFKEKDHNKTLYKDNGEINYWN